MKKILFISTFIFAVVFMFASCESGKSPDIIVKNNSKKSLKNVLIKLEIEKIKTNIDLSKPFRISSKTDSVIPYQLADNNNDGTFEVIYFVSDLKTGDNKFYFSNLNDDKEIKNFKKRTQAEISVKTGGKWDKRKYIGGNFVNIKYLRVPNEHTDHSFYIRYEGPGWESDKVGYRFYLDWRNANDIFGKLVDTMVLQNVGLDGFDSYHEHAPWGQDIFKVGNTLGIGSIAIWTQDSARRVDNTDSVICEILENGVVMSKIKTTYYGWKAGKDTLDLQSYLSISAGERLTKCKLLLSKDIPNICTGLIKDKKASLIVPEKNNGEWSYIATFGKQSLANDSLGIAVFYNTKNLIKTAEDKLNYVVVLKPDNKELVYYFAACWEKEPGGVKNKNEFIAYLNETIEKLNNKPEIIYPDNKAKK